MNDIKIYSSTLSCPLHFWTVQHLLRAMLEDQWKNNIPGPRGIALEEF